MKINVYFAVIALSAISSAMLATPAGKGKVVFGHATPSDKESLDIAFSGCEDDVITE